MVRGSRNNPVLGKRANARNGRQAGLYDCNGTPIENGTLETTKNTMPTVYSSMMSESRAAGNNVYKELPTAVMREIIRGDARQKRSRATCKPLCWKR